MNHLTCRQDAISAGHFFEIDFSNTVKNTKMQLLKFEKLRNTPLGMAGQNGKKWPFMISKNAKVNFF
jgi:hypothetical protein